MHVAIEHHPPEIADGRAQGQFSGDVRMHRLVDTELQRTKLLRAEMQCVGHSHFDVRGVDVTVGIVFGRRQSDASVIVRDHVRVAISRSILDVTSVAVGAVEPTVRNGVELIVDRIGGETRFQIGQLQERRRATSGSLEIVPMSRSLDPHDRGEWSANATRMQSLGFESV